MDSLESLLADLRHRYTSPTSKETGPMSPDAKVKAPASLDQLLTSLEQGRPTLRPLQPHSSLQAEIQVFRHQQQQALQQRLTARAQAWLAKLDPLSTEGLWFTEFAKNYPSPLLAAMELLQCQDQ